MEQDRLIEKYVLGTLTNEEKQQFDTLLKTDATFKEEVEFSTKMKNVARHDKLTAFKSLIEDFEVEEKNTTPTLKPRKLWNTKWLVAASAAVIFGLSYVFWPQQNTTDLFEENFTPYRNVTYSIVRGDNSPKDAKSKAFSAYELGEYETAASQFSDLYGKDRESYYLFYQANALLQLNRAQEAIPLLKKHLKSGDSLSTKTNWFLAMAYLQLEDKKSAIDALNIAAKNIDFKQKEARELLRKLQ